MKQHEMFILLIVAGAGVFLYVTEQQKSKALLLQQQLQKQGGGNVGATIGRDLGDIFDAFAKEKQRRQEA
jgi:hypothetical protein